MKPKFSAKHTALMSSIALALGCVAVFGSAAVMLPFVAVDVLAVMSAPMSMEWQRRFEACVGCWMAIHMALCALACFGWLAQWQCMQAILGLRKWNGSVAGTACVDVVMLLAYMASVIAILACFVAGR